MSQADLDINRGIRAILVRHWIDLGRISVRSIDGKVYLRGALARIAGVTEELTSTIVDAIFSDIRRIRDVRQVYPTLENWTNDTGSWQQTMKNIVQHQTTSQETIKPQHIE